jgi:cytochrome c-type biogenesis protein CcmH/NrfG
MKILTILLDIATVILRLLETEGRVLRRAITNMGWGLASAALAALLVLIAAFYFLMGIYQYLASSQMSPGAASLLVALLALILALVFAGIAKWLTADPK